MRIIFGVDCRICPDFCAVEGIMARDAAPRVIADLTLIIIKRINQNHYTL
jgi:hypothetical protein